MTEEWIEHHGKRYPDLPMDTRVEVKFANGITDKGEWGATVEFWQSNWVHDDPVYPLDITHYRVVTK